MPTRGGRKRRTKRRRGGTRKRFGGDMLKCMAKCRADAKALLSKAKVAVTAAKAVGSNLRSKSAPAALSALERYKQNAKKSQPIVSKGMVDMKKMIKLGKESGGITATAQKWGKPAAGGRKRRGSRKHRRSKRRRGSRKHRRSKRRRGSRKHRRSKRRR